MSLTVTAMAGRAGGRKKKMTRTAACADDLTTFFMYQINLNYMQITLLQSFELEGVPRHGSLRHAPCSVTWQASIQKAPWCRRHRRRTRHRRQPRSVRSLPSIRTLSALWRPGCPSCRVSTYDDGGKRTKREILVEFCRLTLNQTPPQNGLGKENGRNQSNRFQR